MATEDVRILDPRGTVNVTDKPLAPRIASLEGISLGLLDNSKMNADHLLNEVGKVLTDEYNVATVIYKQKDKSPIPAGDIAIQLAETCDAVVNAYGDCGSCTSWCIYDSIDLEDKAVPVATITTDEFAVLGQSEAQSLGIPSLPIITVPHPVSDIPEKQVRAHAQEITDEIRRVLTSDTAILESEYTNKYLEVGKEIGDEGLYCPL